MTVFDNITNKNIDELAEWLSEHCNFDSAPWWKYFDENYCNRCEAEVVVDDDGYEKDYGYCELHNNCRFFKEMEFIPDNKQTIKMWLESECN